MLLVLQNLKLNSKTPVLKMMIILLISSYSIDGMTQGDRAVDSPPAPIIKSNKKTQQSIPKKLIRKFRRDAARLALRMESKKEDLRYQNVVIPRDNIEGIYTMLTNIYQNDETAKSIANCNVHTFPNPSIDHLILIFDRNIEWAQPLRNGISETNSDEINELLDDYDLVIEKHVQWNDNQDAITIRSKEPLNMAALANEFYNIEGVSTIDLGIPKIGGNDINMNRINNGWEVEYVLRFGSYISGKGKIHIWKYRALDDGTIEFVSEGGDPVPEWMRCGYIGEDLVFKF
jgi:hypothetical protein